MEIAHKLVPKEGKTSKKNRGKPAPDGHGVLLDEIKKQKFPDKKSLDALELYSCIKEAGKKWHNMTAAEKAPYLEKSAADDEAVMNESNDDVVITSFPSRFYQRLSLLYFSQKIIGLFILLLCLNFLILIMFSFNNYNHASKKEVYINIKMIIGPWR